MNTSDGETGTAETRAADVRALGIRAAEAADGGAALRRALVQTAAAVLLALFVSGCSTVYYSAMERIGFEKREILANRVESARDSQEEAREQFSSALEEYRAVVEIEGGELEEVYDRLNGEFEDSEEQAEEVRERIDEVESVAEDLFEEWEAEIEEYSDPELRRESQRMLADTREEYGELMQAMRSAEASMEPVLTLFRDQVLFLRHNLNARAISSLENELASIETATTDLIQDMERAIAEASRFIESMG